ncbi:glycerophosphodiester phosphodiesterase [Bacillus marasmi]|uniref:glycerophosphodiester phosphodiesterase n=1 Tax=Bacillus marasmi TaxID=1926279 RepID=UPI0011C9F127|nr:glycerophosphodiester phosphodiesterase [Bacillus marasmi]
MTQIFAHRGYSALYPENTMLAFKEAEKAGADGLELDVQMTIDGEIVVIHDEKIDRTTNGTGLIKNLSLKELRQYNAGYKFKNLPEKTPIPTLEEVFKWMQTNQIVCNIELKNGVYRYEGMEEKVIALIEKYQLAKRIIVSSFNHYSLVHFYRLAPHIETAPLLSESIYMPWIYAKAIGAKGIHPKYYRGMEDIYAQSLANGFAVRPYTVNKEAAIKRLFAMNCTAIITDDPKAAVKIKQMAQ